MTYRKAPWLFAAGGAALGLVVAGAAARVARGRLAPAKRTRDDDDLEDLPRPLQEALAASAHARDPEWPVSKGLARDLANRAEVRRPNPGDHRHEVSSLVARHESGAGTHDEDSAAFDDLDPLLDDRADEPELTAQPKVEPMLFDDMYDAVAPEDLGAEWLARATQAAVPGEADSASRGAEPPDAMLEAGMSVISEGSVGAATAEQLEDASAAELENGPATTDDLPDDDSDDWDDAPDAENTREAEEAAEAGYMSEPRDKSDADEPSSGELRDADAELGELVALLTEAPNRRRKKSATGR